MAYTRRLTVDEVREKFLRKVWSYIHYWKTTKLDNPDQCRVEGLAFSILVILDGGTELPGFTLAANPHPEDKEYHQKEDENWYPDFHQDQDIAGVLHELFQTFKPEAK